MKKIALFIFVSFSLFFISQAAKADGCYLCSGGGYVKYNGDDTFDKRKAAAAQGCQVSGTTSSCSNPKATVGQKDISQPKLARLCPNESKNN